MCFILSVNDGYNSALLVQEAYPEVIDLLAQDTDDMCLKEKTCYEGSKYTYPRYSIVKLDVIYHLKLF